MSATTTSADLDGIHFRSTDNRHELDRHCAGRRDRALLVDCSVYSIGLDENVIVLSAGLAVDHYVEHTLPWPISVVFGELECQRIGPGWHAEVVLQHPRPRVTFKLV